MTSRRAFLGGLTWPWVEAALAAGPELRIAAVDFVRL